MGELPGGTPSERKDLAGTKHAQALPICVDALLDHWWPAVLGYGLEGSIRTRTFRNCVWSILCFRGRVICLAL